MADDAFYSPNYRPPPTQPRAGAHLWTLTKGGRRLDCRLLFHGEYGVEVQLLKNGDFYAGRRFDLHAQATAYAEAERRLLIDEEGWIEPA